MVYALEISPDTFAPARFGTIASLLNLIIPLIILIAALILLLLLIYGSFRVLTAGGDPEKIKEAKHIFTYAIVGFLLIVIAFLATRIIGQITGVNIPL